MPSDKKHVPTYLQLYPLHRLHTAVCVTAYNCFCYCNIGNSIADICATLMSYKIKNNSLAQNRPASMRIKDKQQVNIPFWAQSKCHLIHSLELQLPHSPWCHLSGLQRRAAERDETQEKQSADGGLKSHTALHSLRQTRRQTLMREMEGPNLSAKTISGTKWVRLLTFIYNLETTKEKFLHSRNNFLSYLLWFARLQRKSFFSFFSLLNDNNVKNRFEIIYPLTWLQDLGFLQARDRPDHLLLELRWQRHWQALGVNDIGLQAFRLQPDLMFTVWEAQHLWLKRGAVSAIGNSHKHHLRWIKGSFPEAKHGRCTASETHTIKSFIWCHILTGGPLLSPSRGRSSGGYQGQSAELSG